MLTRSVFASRATSVLGAAVSLCYAAMACAQAPVGRNGTSLESTVDTSIKPGDDFFAYANGSWLRKTTIPAGKDRWGARNELDDITRPRIAQLLADANSAPLGSTARKVADFHAALLNESGIQAKGLAPLKPLLDSINRVQDKLALIRLLAHEMRNDVDPLNWAVYRSASVLGLSIEPSIHGEKTYVAFLVQGGLGLPDREYYVSAEPRMQALRTKYRAYVARMLTLAGCGDADKRADEVLALETAIARTHASREASANDHNADTLWERAHFDHLAPGMDWSVFFAEAGLAKVDAFVPWQPSAVKGVATLVASQPLETWKDYLRVRALDAYADALPAEFAREASALRDATTSGEPSPMSRAQRASTMTHVAMSDAIGRMYAERYFPAEQKARVQAIVANVVAAFAKRLEAVTWMSPATKAVALEKVKTLYVGVGYPERWPDYSDLVVDPGDPVGNVRRVEKRNYRHALALLDTPVDMKEWWIAPHIVGGILIFQQNAYELPAALLQPTKYDPMASDAASYGAIGALVGHDVVHFIDLLGAEYEVDGRMRRWWAPEDALRFKATTEPLVRQFATYRPFPNVALNGTLTQSENVADVGGLAAAFDAYRGALGSKAADKEFVRHSDREFFIAFAQSYRAKLTDAAMRTQAATNDHAPETYRVSTVRNFDAWYDAFDVRPGQRLYLEPAARVRIW
ncbi:MAG: M13 family metallopeptidase [bacterium]